MVPPMPVAFLPVWLGVAVLLGWVGWRSKVEGWFVAAFVWMVLIGPICWLALGARK